MTLADATTWHVDANDAPDVIVTVRGRTRRVLSYVSNAAHEAIAQELGIPYDAVPSMDAVDAVVDKLNLRVLEL